MDATEHYAEQSCQFPQLKVLDVEAYVPLLNLPTDATNVVPWAGVTNGPTGSMPQDFWDWLGSIVGTIVNGLLTVGQLIYGGLMAIATSSWRWRRHRAWGWDSLEDPRGH